MTCFASVFAQQTLSVQNEHPELVRLLNTPLAAEFFFADYWQHHFGTEVYLAPNSTQVGWDFRTKDHKVEVKTCSGQVINDTYKFQINKLTHKGGSYLCTVFDSPDNKYCLVGFAIPYSVWGNVSSDGGRITITMSNDYRVVYNRPEVVEFMKYHTLYDRTSLSMLFDRIRHK